MHDVLLPEVRVALRVLGRSIVEGRHRQRWTQADLAERVGVSRRTIANIEAGSPSVSVGSVLEAAALAGVPLLGGNDESRRALAEAGVRQALLPSRVDRVRGEVDDDF